MYAELRNRKLLGKTWVNLLLLKFEINYSRNRKKRRQVTTTFKIEVYVPKGRITLFNDVFLTVLFIGFPMGVRQRMGRWDGC